MSSRQKKIERALEAIGESPAYLRGFHDTEIAKDVHDFLRECGLVGGANDVPFSVTDSLYREGLLRAVRGE